MFQILRHLGNHRLAVRVICCIIVFVAVLSFLYTRSYPDQVRLNGKVFNVEVVDTRVLLEKGLAGHQPLSNDEGMLFVFQTPEKYGFWMKDMTFPIDIFWIDDNRSVVHIEKSVSPDTYPQIFYPEEKNLYVLETAAGQAEELNTKIGDKLEFIRN